MGRRFWISWAATIAMVMAFYAWWWSNNPSGPGAEAGLEPRRVGFISVPLALLLGLRNRSGGRSPR